LWVRVQSSDMIWPLSLCIFSLSALRFQRFVLIEQTRIFYHIMEPAL
jgi:hypothetical protein